MANLQDLYFAQLKDLYDAEHQLLEALPKMIENASSPELEKALTNHLEETRQQVERLELVFESHEMEPERETCKAMKGLIAEGEKEMKEWKDEAAIRDAAIVASAQRVEHYEMAGYGTARGFAEMLGFSDDVEVLQEILDEEKNADAILNEVAIGGVNRDALLAGEAEEGEEEDSDEVEDHAVFGGAEGSEEKGARRPGETERRPHGRV